MRGEAVVVPATLTLFGHPASAARLEATPRSAPARRTRAALALAGGWALVVPAALIPPHVPWALAAFLAGIYFARRNWRGTHVVHAFDAACPRCRAAVRLRPGMLLRLPTPVTCYGCHSELLLA
jgi:hypothetical protein